MDDNSKAGANFLIIKRKCIGLKKLNACETLSGIEKFECKYKPHPRYCLNLKFAFKDGEKDITKDLSKATQLFQSAL